MMTGGLFSEGGDEMIEKMKNSFETMQGYYEFEKGSYDKKDLEKILLERDTWIFYKAQNDPNKKPHMCEILFKVDDKKLRGDIIEAVEKNFHAYFECTLRKVREEYAEKTKFKEEIFEEDPENENVMQGRYILLYKTGPPYQVMRAETRLLFNKDGSVCVKLICSI
jgi:hypothetical protein